MLSLHAARYYAKRNDAATSIKYYRRAQDHVLADPDDVMRFCELLSEQGEWEEAVSVLDAAIERHRDKDFLYARRGLVLRELGRDTEALQSFNRAIALNPEPYFYWYTRALIYQDLDNWESAILDFRASIKREDSHTVRSTWYELGSAYLRLNQVDEAINALLTAVQDEENAVAIYYYKLGEAFMSAEQSDSAAIALEKALTLYEQQRALPDQGIEEFRRRTGYTASGFESIKEYIDERFAMVLELSELLADLGQLEDACDALSRGIELYPDADVLCVERGLLYVRMGTYKKARADFTRALELDPNYIRALIERALVQSHIGNNEEAIADLKLAAEREPSLSVVHYTLGNLYMSLDRPEDALPCYHTLVEVEPDDPANYLRRAEALLFVGQYEEAIQDCDTAITLRDAPEIRMKRSYMYFLVNRYEESMIDLEHALEMDPQLDENSNFLFARGMNLMNMKHTDLAEAEFTKAIVNDPATPLLYDKRASCRISLGNLEGALEDCDMGLILDDENTSLIWLRAFVHYELGNYRLAVEDTEHYVALLPHDPAGYYNIGLLHMSENQDELAIEWFNKCLEIDPAFAEAYLKRARIWQGLFDLEQTVEDLTQWLLYTDIHLSLDERLEVLEEVEGFQPEVVEEVRSRVEGLYGGSGYVN